MVNLILSLALTLTAQAPPELNSPRPAAAQRPADLKTRRPDEPRQAAPAQRPAKPEAVRRTDIQVTVERRRARSAARAEAAPRPRPKLPLCTRRSSITKLESLRSSPSNSNVRPKSTPGLRPIRLRARSLVSQPGLCLWTRRPDYDRLGGCPSLRRVAGRRRTVGPGSSRYLA